MRELSLHVVGAAHPNRDGSNRRFEILLCHPGDPVALVPEPRNPVDPNAVRVMSERGVQIGYLTAERAVWFAAMLREGRAIAAIFQHETAGGAVIRVAIDGGVPTLPAAPATPRSETVADPEPDFWPDAFPPDD